MGNLLSSSHAGGWAGGRDWQCRSIHLACCSSLLFVERVVVVGVLVVGGGSCWLVQLSVLTHSPLARRQGQPRKKQQHNTGSEHYRDEARAASRRKTTTNHASKQAKLACGELLPSTDSE